MAKFQISDLIGLVFLIAVLLDETKKQHDGETPNPEYASRIYCFDQPSGPSVGRRGDFHVFYNYVPMSTKVKCWESVTFATHADYTYLDNLVPLLERWKAPISVALYAPGSDFQDTVDSIKYLRNCSSPLVSQFVTFHLYYHIHHAPRNIPPGSEVLTSSYDCRKDPPWKRIRRADTYKTRAGLDYPANIGRNIAKSSSMTHYVLVSGIEMYPSANLVPEFLEMLGRNDQPQLFKENRKVFVLPPFEVVENVGVPSNKMELMNLYFNNKVFSYREKICHPCNAVPGELYWKKTYVMSGTLRVSATGKRTGDYRLWNPIFIGTKNDPNYDERLLWNGPYDTSVQGYALCALDYDFLILNNAFIVHRPGIKGNLGDNRPMPTRVAENQVIQRTIRPEYEKEYGHKDKCFM